jgi:hypothetical protein
MSFVQKTYFLFHLFCSEVEKSPQSDVEFCMGFVDVIMENGHAGL